MKVIFTGATGFFGSHAVRALLAAGHEVYAYCRKETDFWRLSKERSDIRWFNLTTESLKAPFFCGRAPDAVIHAAACYGRDGESSSAVASVNTLFPIQLIEAAAQSGCGLFVNIDTYFHKEHKDFNYVTNYSLSKKHLVEWAHTLAPRSGIRVANLKLEHVFGPDDNTAKFVMSIALDCVKSVPEIQLTPGAQVRDFIFISDAVSAVQMILNKADSRPGFESHEVGSGEGRSVRAFVEYVKHAAASSTHLNFGALPYRQGEIMHSVANNASLATLGWELSVPWRDGVERLIASIRGTNL
jgi:CDP-paratose synthetase